MGGMHILPELILCTARNFCSLQCKRHSIALSLSLSLKGSSILGIVHYLRGTRGTVVYCVLLLNL